MVMSFSSDKIHSLDGNSFIVKWTILFAFSILQFNYRHSHSLTSSCFLHLSYNLKKGLGLLLPSDSSVWLLSQMMQTMISAEHVVLCVRGGGWLLCCLRCISMFWAFLVCHKNYPQLQSPQCSCWKSTLWPVSLLWHLQQPKLVKQFKKCLKTLSMVQNNCSHFTNPQLPPVLEQCRIDAETGE